MQRKNGSCSESGEVARTVPISLLAGVFEVGCQRLPLHSVIGGCFRNFLQYDGIEWVRQIQAVVAGRAVRITASFSTRVNMLHSAVHKLAVFNLLAGHEME